jgi:hypothetical protein
MRLKLLLGLVFCSCVVSPLSAQTYAVTQTGIFAPQNKKVILLQNQTGQKPIILFQTRLRVNTDGSPLSYHAQDLRGTARLSTTSATLLSSGE